MQNYKLTNYLLSEGMESIEENLALDIISNAGLAIMIGAITWNRLKGNSEQTIGEKIISKFEDLRKDKTLDDKSPLDRVVYKLSKASEKYESFVTDLFQDLTKRKKTADEVSTILSKKIKFDSDEKKELDSKLKSIVVKLSGMKRLTGE